MKTTTSLLIAGAVTLGAAFMQARDVMATTCTDNVRDNTSYTWNQKTGEGTVTVKEGVQFCKNLYITKAVWDMTNKTGSIWPQTINRDQTSVITIKGAGTYNVSTPAQCRQQTDLYYGYGSPATLPKNGYMDGEWQDRDVEFFSKVSNGSYDNPTWMLNTNACVETKPEPEQPKPVVKDVIATAPTHKEACEAKDDSYTIPAKEGVIYTVNGKVTSAGTYKRTTANVAIVAKAASDSYKLSGTTAWNITFTDEPCDVQKPVKPVEKPTEPQPTTPQVLSTATVKDKPQVIAKTGTNPLQTVLMTLFAGAGVYSALYFRKRQ